MSKGFIYKKREASAGSRFFLFIAILLVIFAVLFTDRKLVEESEAEAAYFSEFLNSEPA